MMYGRKIEVSVKKENGHTHKSAHKLAPDFGTITATSDMRLAAGMMSLLHPTATQMSPTLNALR